ncbi:MAG: hypothetical protein ABIE42_08480 [Candidatus Eisenbacteria bacterium]
MFGLSVLAGVVGNAVFWAGFLAIAWTLLVHWRRRSIIPFFGIKGSRRLVVYLSNIQVAQGGSLTIEGSAGMYSGTAVALSEASVADRIREQFRYPLPRQVDRPGILSKLLVADVKVDVTAAPPTQKMLDSRDPFIALGSWWYSWASRYVEADLPSRAGFQSDGKARIVIEGEDDVSGDHYAYIQRVYDVPRKRFVFQAAGLTELATVGAGYYLATRWQRMYDRYGGRCPFLLVLRIGPDRPERWSVEHEWIGDPVAIDDEAPRGDSYART